MPAVSPEAPKPGEAQTGTTAQQDNFDSPPPPMIGEEIAPRFEELDDDIGEVEPELLEAFGLESEDHLRVIATQMRVLEHDYANRSAMEAVRRSVHTLKGAAGVVGFKAISKLSHRMEDLLDELYDGDIQLNQPLVSLLFATSDALEDLCAGTADKSTLRSTLSSLYERYNTIHQTSRLRSPPG
ncbi:MAG: Hpt domain-containing protein [Myxococcota bacterium]